MKQILLLSAKNSYKKARTNVGVGVYHSKKRKKTAKIAFKQHINWLQLLLIYLQKLLETDLTFNDIPY